MVRTRWCAAMAVLSLAAVTGCGDFPEKYQWTESKVVSHGWLPATAHAMDPIYCYRTLADPVCYPWPREGQETRLVGHYGPEPF